MDINDLTLKQIKEIGALLNCSSSAISATPSPDGIGYGVGKMVIIRTFSAGVWCGKLEQKSGNEVVLSGARRLWRWFAAESISLSGVANYGVVHSKSKIAPAVDGVWLEAIEIIPATNIAVNSIMGAPNAKAE